ncbi:hypothetical protein [Humisphaera borealis]|uniref:Uncharacterized protein n=1 Tax=Humisphaera borealis TaxID=2807512 RepID=A0A7M2WZM4_9BACT|nr:hypothetical protein [Humisphaera borealis]QOV90967.1 hypothetical protein IPV69_06290 [Humisphaera borealis]
MDVAEIASRIDAEPRLVRYVLFHGLVPAAEKASQGRGNRRSFSLAEAFAIAFAVRLFSGGVRQPFVKGLLRGLMENAATMEAITTKPPNPDEAIMFEIADGENVRMRRGRRNKLDDPAWVRLQTGKKLDASYRPGVVTSVDLADIICRLHEQ